MTRELRSIESYPGDGLLEEERTVEERTAPPRRQLDESALRQPIAILPYVSPVCVVRSTSVAKAVRLMQEHNIGAVVVQAAGRLTGIFTERDLLNRVIGNGRNMRTTTLASVMTSDPESLPVDAPSRIVRPRTECRPPGTSSALPSRPNWCAVARGPLRSVRRRRENTGRSCLP